MRGTGGNAQDRRRTKRARERRTTAGHRRSEGFSLAPDDIADIRALVAAATGSTTLPLSDQGTAWDSAAADKRVRAWAGAEDAPNAKYATAFFFKDGDGAAFGDYKLGFADVVDGKLTAIWRGVTAVAGVLQGARGGVEGVSDADKASIKTKVAGYYSKAAKAYNDDGIRPPWEADGESAIAIHEAFGMTNIAEASEWDEVAVAATVLAYAELGATADLDAFSLLYDFWMLEILGGEPSPERLALYRERMGGKPNPGTKPDRRLKENKPAAKQPEQAALEALDAYEAERDRLAREISETLDDDPARIATAYIKIRPDLEGFEAEVEAAVRRALERGLTAAAGDVAWGPEDGFIDLLCDVNEILGGDSYDEVGGYGYVRAIDAGVKLDKVLICDGDDYWVAPIEIDANGEPVLSERTEWRPVEQGWVETNVGDDDSMSAAAKLRFSLRDLVLTADGALAPPIPPEHQPGEKMPPRRPSPMAPPDAPKPQNAAEGEIPWTATFVPEGVLTEDGRAFAPGSIILPPLEGARELPLTLMAMTKTSAEGGHDGAEVAGRIDQLWREGNLVKASGVFDKGVYGAEIARMVGEQVLRGLSVDIAPLEWERTPAADWFDEAGNWIAQQDAEGEWVPAASDERSLEDAVELLFSEEPITVITKAVIGMATVCPFPAFGKANISLAASGAVWRYLSEGGFETLGDEALVAAAVEAPAEVETPEGGETLTAAAAGMAPLRPPADWFADPQFDGLTPLTIDEDGRVFGHAWEWGTCHLAFDECVTPPSSETEYAYFQLGEIECEDGERLAVGKITLDASHAGQRLSRADAVRHYNHTGTVAAHVCFGEDDFGGWFAGAIHPELSAEKLRILRGATISGDWRGVHGNLELIALLAVNVPGFPVPRARALVAAGDQGDEPEVVSLTAAGIVRESVLTAEEVAVLRALTDAVTAPIVDA